MKKLLILLIVLFTLSSNVVLSADFDKGYEAVGRGDYKTALQELKPLANNGFDRAQFLMGFMYVYGLGVSQDYKTAVKWFMLAAKQGHGGGQLLLGKMYYFGHGVSKDSKTAVKWFKLAAKQEKTAADAQFMLGVAFYEGHGVSQDYKTAVKWYARAAEQGNVHAQHNLGFMYHNGYGVSQDDKTALKWFTLAANQGHADAKTAKAFLLEQQAEEERNYKDGVQVVKVDTYPVNNSSYERVNEDVGCGSTYSKEKRTDVFNSKYKNQWMKWRGEIVIVSSDKVSLNVDNFGTQDLSVYFEKKGAGYNLREGQWITVRFLMKSTGGCFLPFGGERATIVSGERATIVSDAKKVEGKRKEEEGHFFANMICEEFNNSEGPIPTEAVSLLATIGIDPEAGSNFNSSFNTKFCDCVQKRTRLRISPERIKEVNRKYKINPNADNLTNDSEGLFFASLAVTCSLFP